MDAIRSLLGWSRPLTRPAQAHLRRVLEAADVAKVGGPDAFWEILRDLPPTAQIQLPAHAFAPAIQHVHVSAIDGPVVLDENAQGLQLETGTPRLLLKDITAADRRRGTLAEIAAHPKSANTVTDGGFIELARRRQALLVTADRIMLARAVERGVPCALFHPTAPSIVSKILTTA